ncbi:MAG: SpoIIE family protein phosphatase [Fretibacterium sp.]|nr:SpoIIE family protein phosphatase [Fretibacterium sp.]
MTVRFRSKLTFQILAGVVAVFVVLCGIVSYIGYCEFTDALEAQYESKAYGTALTAAEDVKPAFLDTGNISVQEQQMMHQFLRQEWQRLADTQDATFIYIIQPDRTDYRHITFIQSVMNSSAHYEHYPSGYVRPTTNEEYRQAYKAICEGGQERATIFRDKGFIETGHHITVIIPLRSRNGEVKNLLCVQRQMNELRDVRNTYVRHVVGVTAVLLLLMLLLYGWYLKRHLLDPIQQIADETLRFAQENTQPSVPLGLRIKSSNEIGQLARTIDRMEADIRDYIENLTRVTQEKEQFQAELNVATKIQADMLPRTFPSFPARKEFALFATMTPAKEVGGDFYDFFMIDDKHLALVIADVSGKGIPAALFMVIAKTLIKNRASMGGSPSEILKDVNKSLCDGNESGFFVTVWLGILDISTGKIAAANAGHEYPVIKRAGGSWELIKDKHSPAVAVLETMKFRETEMELRPGDSLYLYTDGVAEATNSNKELYGTERMIDALNRHMDETVIDLLTSMKREVDDFVGDAPQFDDITMLTLNYWGDETKLPAELTVEAQTKNLEKVIAFLCGHLEEHGCPPKVKRQIEIAAEEIFVNIANYAYTSPDTAAPGKGSAAVRFAMDEREAVITFIDSGIPYDPLAKPDPDLTLSAKERPIGGLGIYMVKKTMDSVAYERRDGHNIFTMRKTIAG